VSVFENSKEIEWYRGKIRPFSSLCERKGFFVVVYSRSSNGKTESQTWLFAKYRGCFKLEAM